MLQSQLSAFLTSIMPLWFGTCVLSTEDTHRSTVHIWSVLALFLIGLQYNHLIELTAKSRPTAVYLASLVDLLGDLTLTLLRHLASFLLLGAGLKLGAFPPCSVVWNTVTCRHTCQRPYCTSAWSSDALPVICHSVNLPYTPVYVSLSYLSAV